MKKQQRQEKRNEAQIERFNQKYKPGEIVLVKDDFNEIFTDTIKAPASFLSETVPVAWLEKKGPYRLDRVIGKEVGND